jgi:ACT domain-containing protein
LKGIITVIGYDKVGIIAKICMFLSESGINVLDISQTIVQGFFNMLMIVDMTDKEFSEIDAHLQNLGEEIGVSVKLQSEEIFNAMHRI